MISFALRPNPALRACCHASAKGGEGGGRGSALPCVLTRPCLPVAIEARTDDQYIQMDSGGNRRRGQ